mmetsp:Transcript_69968/g.195717  ORF Transcript_69968/g.195717 Transcript_69968/m.195717 type:complete len:280 (+) Transcript_69968:1116-1955(+)
MLPLRSSTDGRRPTPSSWRSTARKMSSSRAIRRAVASRLPPSSTLPRRSRLPVSSSLSLSFRFRSRWSIVYEFIRPRPRVRARTFTRMPGPSLAAGLALFSPWVDLRNSAVDTLSMKHCNPEDGALANYGTCDYLPVDGVTAVSYAYANSADREDKLISPSAATVEDLVPLGASTVGTDGEAYTMKCFLTWGTGEILQDQQEAMGAKLADAGIKVTTYAATDMPHDSAVVGACMIYNTGPGGDYSKFEPTKVMLMLARATLRRCGRRTIRPWCSVMREH